MNATSFLTEVHADLAAFADDDEDVIVEPNGQCLLVRHGEAITFSLTTDDSDELFVVQDGVKLRYRKFLTHTLAQLDVLADRILQRRPPLPTYVDGSATLRAPTEAETSGTALDLLATECETHPAFVARVLFITADAGQGKTALLRQFQHQQAERFLRADSSYVFWHVDLQGRQLLRLSEALMGDLGDMRVAGLWMPAIIRLLRHRSLVLAIDGFDELAAEQGGGDALGALALLVQEVGDRGTIVAASRRTFFDTEDYVARSRVFSRTGGGDCQFDQLSLDAWGRSEVVKYLSAVEVDGDSFPTPAATYDQIVQELGADDHTMVTRPFLVAQIARALLRFKTTPQDFIRGMGDPYKGVASVIEAFVDREVREKWKRKDTGNPFLTKSQHLRFLADVAEEMLRSQRTTLSIDVIETIASLLLDDWQIDQMLRQQILEMVRMHVLLPPPSDGDFRMRTFDHEEFLAWFSAYALKDGLERMAVERDRAPDLLSTVQLSDGTASYVCALIEREPARVGALVDELARLLAREWKPTFLQVNVGTLLPYLLDGLEPTGRFEFDGRAVFSSIVFEKSRLRRVTIRNASFVQTTLLAVDWSDVVLERCSLGVPTFDRAASYRDVVLRNCSIDGIRLVEDGVETREYAPERVVTLLGHLGVEVTTDADDGCAGAGDPIVDGETRKLVRRVLNIFRRTTFLSDATLAQRLPRDARQVREEILPLMIDFEIVEQKLWRGAGKQSAWGLHASLEQIEKADGDQSHRFHPFWARVDELDSQK
jgi:hypothetical protein